MAGLEAGNAGLRKELAVERMEKEALLKATAYVARESLPGTRS
jgi:transposase